MEYNQERCGTLNNRQVVAVSMAVSSEIVALITATEKGGPHASRVSPIQDCYVMNKRNHGKFSRRRQTDN